MPGAYSSFDTLTLELGEASAFGAAAGPLPVLAKISHAAPDDPQQDPQLSDDQQDAESAPLQSTSAPPVHSIQSAHQATPAPQLDLSDLAASVFEVHADTPRAVPVEPKSQELPRQVAGSLVEPSFIPTAPAPSQIDSPAPTDQVSSTRIDTTHVKPTFETPTPPSLESPYDEPGGLTAALLKIESAVAPYSQIVVLITLLAAAGLTLLLVQSEAGRLDNTAPTTPSADGSLEPALAATSAAPNAPNAEFPPARSLATVAAPAVPQSQVAISHGDATKSMGPVGVKPLEPHREPIAAPAGATQRSAIVAQNPTNLPETAYPAAGYPTAGYPSTEVTSGTTETPVRPYARLSGIRTHQRQTR